MTESEETNEPDLTAGLPASAVTDGVMVSGRVGDETVVVASSNGEYFAFGGTCTHYGGPLAEGLLVGDTVRCPWHHACFDIRTGEPLRAPALNPISCWKVERVGDTLFVRDKLPAAPRKPALRADETFVIVGAGAAGHAAAEMLRREGFAGRLILLEATSELPSDRPNLSKDYLAGTAPEEWIPLRPPEFYDENDIDLRREVQVRAIDPEQSRVLLEEGNPLHFDRLLIATGATPVRLWIPGCDLPHVRYLRTVEDSRAIIAAAESAKRAVIVGAGFIGLEVAASLRTRGLDVHVIAPEEIPMERILGKELGSFVKDLHEEHGVQFHLGQSIESVEQDAVVTDSGARLPADLVVLGVGVRPDVQVAAEAGLTIDNGVLVDQYLLTSADKVYAAGDIARWPYRPEESARVEHWVVAQRQGQTAARNMLGQKERFDAVPFFWSQHYDVPICYVGYARGWDRIDIAGSISDRDCIVAYRSGDRTLAVASIFRDRESLEAEVALERGDEDALARLIPHTTRQSPEA